MAATSGLGFSGDKVVSRVRRATRLRDSRSRYETNHTGEDELRKRVTTPTGKRERKVVTTLKRRRERKRSTMSIVGKGTRRSRHCRTPNFQRLTLVVVC